MVKHFQKSLKCQEKSLNARIKKLNCLFTKYREQEKKFHQKSLNENNVFNPKIEFVYFQEIAKNVGRKSLKL